MALALVEHLNLAEDTTAAVTRPFLDYLQQKSTKAEPTLSRNSPFVFLYRKGWRTILKVLSIHICGHGSHSHCTTNPTCGCLMESRRYRAHYTVHMQSPIMSFLPSVFLLANLYPTLWHTCRDSLTYFQHCPAYQRQRWMEITAPSLYV